MSNGHIDGLSSLVLRALLLHITLMLFNDRFAGIFELYKISGEFSRLQSWKGISNSENGLDR